MVNLKAIRNFNYGGIHVKKEGDTFQAKSDDANKMLALKLVENVSTSHKKMDKK